MILWMWVLLQAASLALLVSAAAPQLYLLQLLLPDCIHFSCCSLIVTAFNNTYTVQITDNFSEAIRVVNTLAKVVQERSSTEGSSVMLVHYMTNYFYCCHMMMIWNLHCQLSGSGRIYNSLNSQKVASLIMQLMSIECLRISIHWNFSLSYRCGTFVEQTGLVTRDLCC